MIDEIIQRVIEYWYEIQPEITKPANLIPVIQSRNKVIVFLFEEKVDSTFPLVVAKFYRNAEYNSQLEDATRKAIYIRSILKTPICETIPRMVSLGQINKLSVVVESVLPGMPVHAQTIIQKRQQVFFNYFRAYADWLVPFQKSLITGRIELDQNVLASTLFNPLSNYIESDREFHNFMSRLECVSKDLLGLQIPLCWRFGDAHPSNILMLGNKVSGVIDWEGIKMSEWPIFDWLQFALSFTAECVYKTNPMWNTDEIANEALKILITPSTSIIGSVFKSETERYFSFYSIGINTLPALMTIFLLQYYYDGDKSRLIKTCIHNFTSNNRHHDV